MTSIDPDELPNPQPESSELPPHSPDEAQSVPGNVAESEHEGTSAEAAEPVEYETAVDDAEDAPPVDDGRPLVALGSWSFFIKRFVIFGLLMAGYGSEFFFDGFIRWPAERRAAYELELQGKHPDVKPHSETDILINRIIGVIIPPMGLLLLVLTVYDIRYAYEMEDDVLRVPGHPPIPFTSITGLDKSLWERKGIAYVEYSREMPDGTTKNRRAKLDDYAYEQLPTDRMVDRIDAYLNRASASENESEVV